MSQVDQFESIFRSAIRERYEYEEMFFKRVVFVTDLPQDQADAFVTNCGFFSRILSGDSERIIIKGGDFETTDELLALLDSHNADLICTYRSLHSDSWKHPHSLGEYLDVVIQKALVPVLVLPHPDSENRIDCSNLTLDCVIAATDHLVCNHDLINSAVTFCSEKARLVLMHIEDDAVFEKYMTTISKIPTIDTDMARETISRQLLKEPSDYISSCVNTLEKSRPDVSVSSIVDFGHHLSEYKAHIEKEGADLLVMNGRDEDQYAMHGLAYPLAVEIRSIPLLFV